MGAFLSAVLAKKVSGPGVALQHANQGIVAARDSEAVLTDAALKTLSELRGIKSSCLFQMVMV